LGTAVEEVLGAVAIMCTRFLPAKAACLPA
jgi:hypothetical protein